MRSSFWVKMAYSCQVRGKWADCFKLIEKVTKITTRYVKCKKSISEHHGLNLEAECHTRCLLDKNRG